MSRLTPNPNRSCFRQMLLSHFYWRHYFEPYVCLFTGDYVFFFYSVSPLKNTLARNYSIHLLVQTVCRVHPSYWTIWNLAYFIYVKWHYNYPTLDFIYLSTLKSLGFYTNSSLTNNFIPLSYSTDLLRSFNDVIFSLLFHFSNLFLTKINY